MTGGRPPITGVPTSITAFVGFATRGPVDTPTPVTSLGDFARVFGGLALTSTMSYAVRQFFENGGQHAVVVRCTGTGAARAQSSPPGSAPGAALTLKAVDEGFWGDQLLMRIDHDTADPALFNLSVKDNETGTLEAFPDLPAGPSLGPAIAARSTLVRLDGAAPATRPDPHAVLPPGADPFDPAVPARFSSFAGGKDGAQAVTDLVPPDDDGSGMFALTGVDLFNLLVIPPVLPARDPGEARVLTPEVKGRAARFALAHRALFIVDPDPGWHSPPDITASTGLQTSIGGISPDERPNAALYFPYLRASDPLQGGAVMDYPPAGAIAGVFARNDSERGVWKAPAGLETGLLGVQGLAVSVSDQDNAVLHPLAVNCLRSFPSATIGWCPPTIARDERISSEWKYVQIRRVAVFLEASLIHGIEWAVFEPNAEPLWAQLRQSVGGFMHALFAQGAFQGSTSRESYFVKCDAQTTPQADVDNGIVNIIVGFAPLKPAEFVIVRIQQLVGQQCPNQSL